jgi:VWFA-related protein
MKKLFSLLLLVCLLGGAVSNASAQGGGITLSIDSSFTGQYPGVLVYVTVRDANGVPIVGLKPENFEINEDRIPKTIRIDNIETRVNANTGIWVIMAIDVSGSMIGQRLTDAKAAATRFLDTMTEKDRVAVYAFSGAVDMDKVDAAREISFTTDKKPLYDFINKLQAAGGTPLYDTAYKAALMFDKVPTTEARAILFFTDGMDDGSRIATRDTGPGEAQKRAIPVFTIGLADADTTFIKELSRRTGGEYQPAADSAALKNLFEGVAKRLKSQYVLSYVSTLPADGQKHRLSVKVTVNGVSATQEVEMGPLPQGATATPVPTLVPTATLVPTLVPTPTPTPIEVPPSVISGSAIGIGVVVLVVFLVLGYAIIRTRGQSIK